MERIDLIFDITRLNSKPLTAFNQNGEDQA